ncbi:hypothetical protein K4F52_004108 [Lecanicillium sp. MT-2017a]|nr:hypothetical protein K4F52_004108 [Lecanicillium sp. MT-2017a]
MASVTRSNRRAEGFPPPRSHPHLHTNHHHHVNGNAALAPRAAAQQGAYHAQDRRTKRGPDAADRDFNSVNPKKTRIAVEILARPPPSSQKAHPPVQRPAAAAPVSTTPVQPPKPASLPAESDPDVTKHQVKVINGIKHELDRLQPQMAGPREQGRKLRSQEATRFKSELSAYFPDYDEVIGNDPKEQHVLNLDTPMIVIDTIPRRVGPHGQQQHQPFPNNESFPVRGYGDALYTEVCDAQQIDFGFLEAQYKNRVLDDPLPDSAFQPIHKRAERLERSIRNSEKGRAQHEKDQIIRLLEGLQGHDWLRVMGVSGITDTKKKMFEPAREYFIKGCQAILEKFRTWNMEEKRRKLEKDRLLAEQAEEELRETQQSEVSGEADEDEEMGEAETETGTAGQTSEGDEAVEEEVEELLPSQDDSSVASSSSPAKQLRQEALARSKLAAAKRPRSGSTVTPRQSETPKEFRSFFNKKYEREGALNNRRRTGRKVMAWGHPVPEISEVDFDLPEEYRDDETLRTRARRKRRDKRAKP